MSEFDVTRLSDYALGEKYFDHLDLLGKDDEDVISMKTELEERDLLFQGYLIHDWIPGFRVKGCPYFFKTLELLKDYLLKCKGVEPTEDGSMVWID
jgi:hypothetical protein